MAKTYKIGQHLYQGTNNDTLVDIDNYYSKPIALEDYKIINTIRDNNGYYTIIQLENGKQFEVGKCYYLYFELVPSDTDKNILLSYNSKRYEIIFSPEKACNQVIFQVETSNNYVSHTLSIDNLEIRVVNNLIGSVLGDSTMTSIRELTIEGDENIFFVLNNEDIKIGPSNYYKIYDDYNISFIGFVFNQQNTKTSFIMNYKY